MWFSFHSFFSHAIFAAHPNIGPPSISQGSVNVSFLFCSIPFLDIFPIYFSFLFCSFSYVILPVHSCLPIFFSVFWQGMFFSYFLVLLPPLFLYCSFILVLPLLRPFLVYIFFVPSPPFFVQYTFSRSLSFFLFCYFFILLLLLLKSCDPSATSPGVRNVALFLQSEEGCKAAGEGTTTRHDTVVERPAV